VLQVFDCTKAYKYHNMFADI